MSSSGDTIAAISTAAGEAGIAVVRVSGPDSLKIADALFQCGGLPPSARPGNSFVHGYVRTRGTDGRTNEVDEVVLLIFRAPKSYTREDVVEIQGHGGRLSAKRVLRAVLDGGARMAEPGEFTRRAFLNGRIDLLQAEAVSDLIRAQSDAAAAMAVEHISGSLSAILGRSYDDLVSSGAELTAMLDFPEEDIPDGIVSEVVERLESVRNEWEALLETWEEGHLLREGLRAVILGRTNVGKSTLFNALLGMDRAIVSGMSGTTRDTLEETLVLEGAPIRLVDTAGLRETSCEVERMGVERAYECMKRAQLVLYVVDASQPMNEEDRNRLSQNIECRCIVVLNKTDMGQCVFRESFPAYRVVETSLTNSQGIREIRKAITMEFGLADHGPVYAAISERHRQIIQNALNDLNIILVLLRDNASDNIVPAADLLRDVSISLGILVGRIYNQDMIDSVFGRFCVGK